MSYKLFTFIGKYMSNILYCYDIYSTKVIIVFVQIIQDYSIYNQLFKVNQLYKVTAYRANHTMLLYI